MKKKYVAPSFMCMEVNTTKMICSSIAGGAGGEGRPANTRLHDTNFMDDEDWDSWKDEDWDPWK